MDGAKRLWHPAAQALLWLGAVWLLARRNSPWTPVASVALAVWCSHLRWRRRGPSAAVGVSGEDRDAAQLPISPPVIPPPLRPLLKLSAAGALILLALVSEGTGRAIAAGVFGAGAAIIVLARLPLNWVVRLNRVSTVLAVLLIAAGLVRWGAMRLLGIPVEDVDPGARVEASTLRRSDDPTFRGVVLLTPPPPEREFTAPPPPLSPRDQARAQERRQAEPLVIPFTGVYWLFHRPDLEPPPTSLEQTGSPEDLYFRAADHRPLMMEAHQHLGRRLDLRGTACIDVELKNADRLPGTVELELWAADTSLSATFARRLGQQPVGPAPPWSSEAGGEARSERIRFPLQLGPDAYAHLDRLTVRYRLPFVRNTRSARIAIRSFTLVPRVH